MDNNKETTQILEIGELIGDEALIGELMRWLHREDAVDFIYHIVQHYGLKLTEVE